MLSKEEKREMVEDGLNPQRRKQFTAAQKKIARREKYQQENSLDEFIQFLTDIQAIFSPFISSQKKPLTFLNRL